MLAEVWNAEGIEALLSLMARTRIIRDHELIQELHAQSVECEQTAPEVAAQLHRVAALLTELHAGLRAAESIADLVGLLRWQAQVPWRQSEAMHQLLAAVAKGAEGPEAWPWRLERVPMLRAEIDRLLAVAEGLTSRPVAERRDELRAEPDLLRPELQAWLRSRAALDDAQAARYARLAEHVRAWQRVGLDAAPDPGARAGDPSARAGRLNEEVLAELMELWHRLDPALDRVSGVLGAEVVTGQRSVTEAMAAVVVGVDAVERRVHRQMVLLHHLLDEPMVPVRRAALVACSQLVMSPDAQAFERLPRAQLVRRWGAVLELHWRVLPDPPAALEAALRVVDHTLPSVLDGTAPQLACELLLTRARLLRRVAGWREGQLGEARRAYEMALDAPDARVDRVGRGRALAELAGLRRAQREAAAAVQDHDVRELYDQALELLEDAVLVRARVLADYGVYLARPLRTGGEDGTQAQALVRQAVELVASLPPAVRDHPLVRGDEAQHLVDQANVELEVGMRSLGERQAAAAAGYAQALERLGEGEELFAGVVHLDLACVSLAQVLRQDLGDALERTRRALEQAVHRLAPLPVLHARAVAELALLEARAAPDDEAMRERSIGALEAALLRLPLRSAQVVRGRLERQLGELYLARGGDDDLGRAAERFAAARGTFVAAGASRLSVEAARDYAEVQLRRYAAEGTPGLLTGGAVALEQAALVAEQRWAARRPHESMPELAAMLDGVYGDLAWFQAQLQRPAEQLLATVTRAKRFRATPSLRALRGRAERSSILDPAYFDPLVRRVPWPAVAGRRASRRSTPSELRARVEQFAAAEPRALAVDLTLTRWGTVVVGVDAAGLRYGTIGLTRDRVRRWVWGEPTAPGWWSSGLAHREARRRGDAVEAERWEQTWRAAGPVLARELGRHLLEPMATALSCSLAERTLVIAGGRLSGLPLAAGRVGAHALAQHVEGLARVGSLADLPPGPLPTARSSRALCVLASSVTGPEGDVMVEELSDVVRLLASARAEVEVLACRGEATGPAVYRPTQAKTRGRTVVSEQFPTIAAMLERVEAGVDHFYYSGQGVPLDPRGGPSVGDRRVGVAALRQGIRWAPGSSVFVSSVGYEPPLDDDDYWDLLHALGDGGVGYVIASGCPIDPEIAREFSRGFYLYWALGRSIPAAYCAALSNVAGGDPACTGALMVWLGSGEASGPGRR